MLQELSKRLDRVRERKSEIDKNRSRLEGKLEAAEQSLVKIDEECRSKGIDPEKIDEVLSKLTKHYEEQVITMETHLEKCDQKLRELIGKEA